VLLRLPYGTMFPFFLQLTVDLIGLGFCSLLRSPFHLPVFPGREDIHRKVVVR
jgi:hypothetical protein